MADGQIMAALEAENLIVRPQTMLQLKGANWAQYLAGTKAQQAYAFVPAIGDHTVVQFEGENCFVMNVSGFCFCFCTVFEKFTKVIVVMQIANREI